jgi:argonaute-like protein implicated in RNA metabolism and viral defense
MYSAETVLQVDQAQRKVIKMEDTAVYDPTTLEALKRSSRNLSNRVIVERVLQREPALFTPEKLGMKPREGRPYAESELVHRIWRAFGCNSSAARA